MRTRIENIQAIRGVAVLLVLGYHLMQVELKYLPGARVLPDFLYGGIAGVDLFFVVSGFIMATITRGSFQQPARILCFLYNRATRIYPVYWFYSLLVLGLYLVRPDMVNPSQGSQVNIVASFLLVPQDRMPLLMVGWTLILEVYFYAAMTMMLLAPERRVARWLLVWAVGVVGAASLPLKWFPATAHVVAWLAHPMTLEFIAGALAARIRGSGFAPRRPWMLLAGFVLLFFGWAGYCGLHPRSYPQDWLRVAIFGVPGVMIVSGAVGMEAGSALVLPKALRSVGDASYSLYLSHALVTSAVGLGWSMIGLSGAVNNAVGLLLCLAAALAAGFAGYHWLEKPLIDYFRRRRDRVVSLIVRVAVPSSRTDSPAG